MINKDLSLSRPLRMKPSLVAGFAFLLELLGQKKGMPLVLVRDMTF